MDGNSKLIKMPFDQYGRYLRVSEIINELAARKKQNKFSILDVGGYNGSLHRFFSAEQAEITVLDIYDSDQPNYVKGSGTKMPFQDASFDYVVSFEVFEHIPRVERKKFITESLRVTKGPVLLTAPFAGEDNEVLFSEELVNSLWKGIHGKNHQWLEEHIMYKTPKLRELESIFKAINVSYKRIGNNELTLWNLMQSLTFLTTIYRDSGKNDSVQKFYNQNWDTLESVSDIYYRYIFLIGEDSTLKLNSMQPGPSKSDPKKNYELINKVFHSISADVLNLAHENRSAKKQVNDLQDENSSLKQELESIKSSRSWKIAQQIIRANKTLRLNK